MGGAAATVPFGGDQDAAEYGLKAVALNEIFGAVGRHRQILADDRAAGPQNMVAQPSGSLGIVFEHAGAEYRNGWDAGAKRMFMRQLVDAGGETADGGRSPFAEAGADIARKKEAIAARLASADDRDGRFGETRSEEHTSERQSRMRIS